MTKESVSVSYKGKDYEYRVGDMLRSARDCRYIVEIISFEGNIACCKLDGKDVTGKIHIDYLPKSFIKIKSDKPNKPLKEELNISFESNSVEGLYEISFGPNDIVLIGNDIGDIIVDILDIDNLVSSLLRVKEFHKNNKKDTQ